jgi:hypothetical protein
VEAAKKLGGGGDKYLPGTVSAAYGTYGWDITKNCKELLPGAKAAGELSPWSDLSLAKARKLTCAEVARVLGLKNRFG